MTRSPATPRLPLFDRCKQPEPGRGALSARVIPSELRESIRHELSALFNATALTAIVDLECCPQVARSVLNYGLTDLSGRTASSIDTKALEHELLRAIRHFEPRLCPESVWVRAMPRAVNAHNTLSFEVGGAMAGAASERLAFRTHFDLESGQTHVQDAVH